MTDQDLLDASRNAEIACVNSGFQRAAATGVTTAAGVKTVSFQCVPR